MASLTWWTWVWASCRSRWWTGKPGVLQSMGSQRIGHDWATELNWIDWMFHVIYWILRWKWKQNVWVRNSYKCIGCLPLWSRGWLGSVACCHYLISWENIISHTASLGKDKNSKLEVYFLLNVYHFCTNVKSKNCKLNHHKLETLSTKQNNGAAINNQHQYVRHISELPWK